MALAPHIPQAGRQISREDLSNNAVVMKTHKATTSNLDTVADHILERSRLETDVGIGLRNNNSSQNHSFHLQTAFLDTRESTHNAGKTLSRG